MLQTKTLIIISYILASILVLLISWDLKTFQSFQIFIFSIISFAISRFISDKFKLSDNKFIKHLQKFVFINLTLSFIGLILYIFDVPLFNSVFCDNDSDAETNSEVNKEEITKNEEETAKNKDKLQVTTSTENNKDEFYNITIQKGLLDKALETTKDLINVGAKNIGASLGIGTALGKVASEALRKTAGMAPTSKLAIVGSTALVTTTGSKIGLEFGQAAILNKQKEFSSNLDENGTESINSPTQFEGGFIHSALEDSEIPLILVVQGLSYLNYIEFILILNLFFLLFRKYLSKILKRFILNLKTKYIKKTEVESSNDENVSINKAFNTLDKYTDYVIVYIFICLFWIKFINIYFSSNLAENIDSFVKVYNLTKNNSFICLLFTINKEYIVPKNIFCDNININRNLIFPLSLDKLTEMKFINIFRISLKKGSPLITIVLCTLTISILLAFMEVAPLLVSSQITSYFIWLAFETVFSCCRWGTVL